MPETNPFEQAAQSNPQAAQAAQAPASNPFEATPPSTDTPISTTPANTGTPSYLDEVQNHVTNTAKALWHGISGQTEDSTESGTPTDEGHKQLGFTNENVAYKGGSALRQGAEFFGGLAKDVATMKPLPTKGTNLEENSPELAKSLVGKYIAAPSIAERDKAAESLRQYYNAPDTASAVSHGLNFMLHKTGQWVPLVGPFAASLVESAEKGDIGGSLAQIAAFEAFSKATGYITDPIKNRVGLAMLSPEDRTALADEAAKRAAAAKQAEAARAAGKAAAKAQTLPPPAQSNTPSVMIGPQPRTVAGERTTLTPTTQTTAGVEAPIPAILQENPSAVTKHATESLTNPGAAKEFQKTQTYPAAEKQLISTGGQVVEDKINRHEAIMNGKPTPDQIAGTQTPSKFQTYDEAAQAAEATAQKTYKKADAASDDDIAVWQHTVKEALNAHKELLDRHNANIDAYNANLAEGETPMAHAAYDPNAVSLPEKPQSYSELKAELDRAKADGASSDAAVREEAYKTGIPKAEKAIDGWFKQHSDVISPAEYDSAKKLYADSQRFQEIANGLRASTAKGTITGNTLRGLEANMDNRMIKRGQGPGAFKRLMGEDGYDNWQNVTKLFDPVKGAPKGVKSWGVYALEAAGALAAPTLALSGIAGTMATKFLMDRVMFNPAWGKWFSKLATNLKDMVTREHGELGAPGTVGEKFGEGGAKKEFDDLMAQAQGKAAAEARSQAQPEPEAQLETPKPAPRNAQGESLEYKNDNSGKTNLQHSVTTTDAKGNKIGELAAQDTAPKEVTVRSNQVYDPAMRGAGRGPDQLRHLLKSVSDDTTKVKSDISTSGPARGAWEKLLKENPEAVTKKEYKGGQVQYTVEMDKWRQGLQEPTPESPRTTLNPFDQTEGARETMNRDPNMPLAPGQSPISDIAKRAQELKTATPEASTTHITPVDPEDRAVVNAGRPSPEQIAELDKQGMATRIPKTKDADVTNNPSHSRGLDAINEADKLNPTKEKPNGDIKLGHKATIAEKLADYPSGGVSLTAEERANPTTVINKYLDHFTGNLKDLYNSVPKSIKEAAVKWYETAHYSAKDMADRYGVSQPQATAVIASLSPQNFWDNNVGLADRFIKHWTDAKNHMWDPQMDAATDRVRDVQTKKIAKDEGKGKVASVVFRDILDNIRGKGYGDLQKFAEDQGMDTNALRRLQSQWLRMYDEAHGSPRTPLYSPDGSLRGTTARTHVPYDMEAKAIEILETGKDNLQHTHEVMGDGQKIRNFYNNIINPWSKEGHVTIDTHAVGAAWGKPVSSADKIVTDNFSGAPGNGELGLSGMYSVYEEAYRRAAKELGVAPRELQSVTWEAIRSLIEEQDKKSPEFRKDIDNIWKQVEDKKVDRAEGMKQVIKRAGDYKKPDWVRPEDWKPSGLDGTPKE